MNTMRELKEELKMTSSGRQFLEEVAKEQCEIFPEDSYMGIYLRETLKMLQAEPCEDAISRQAVNELFNSEIKMYEKRIESRKGSNYHDETERIREFRCRIANAEHWKDKIKELPHVKPVAYIAKVNFSKEDMQEIVDKRVKEIAVEPRWIPVSEKLPEEAYGCIVTVMDTNPMTLEEFENIYPDFVGWDGEKWNDADGDSIPFEVIAWMPLPEPHKEGEEE